MNFSEQEFLLRFFDETRTGMLVDVGAHNGAFAWPFAKRGWSVLAFEPELKNYKAFNRSFRFLRGIECMRRAVSDVTGNKVPFYVSHEHHGIHALRPFHSTHQKAYSVETIRIDDALKDLKIKAVDLLKIDIEGADYLALRSFDFVKYRPQVIMVEFMDERSNNFYGYSYHDMVEFMTRFEYSTFVSEWAPIVEYARKGEINKKHRWIRCLPYPIDHEPSWGNLFFVPTINFAKFERLLSDFLKNPPCKKREDFAALRKIINSMPGSRLALNIFLNIGRCKLLN
jgi:FkbM family methyltransferase